MSVNAFLFRILIFICFGGNRSKQGSLWLLGRDKGYLQGYQGNSDCSISTSNFQNGSEINAESAFLTINSLPCISNRTYHSRVVYFYLVLFFCPAVHLEHLHTNSLSRRIVSIQIIHRFGKLQFHPFLKNLYKVFSQYRIAEADLL